MELKIDYNNVTDFIKAYNISHPTGTKRMNNMIEKWTIVKVFNKKWEKIWYVELNKMIKIFLQHSLWWE